MTEFTAQAFWNELEKISNAKVDVTKGLLGKFRAKRLASALPTAAAPKATTKAMAPHLQKTQDAINKLPASTEPMSMKGGLFWR